MTATTSSTILTPQQQKDRDAKQLHMATYGAIPPIEQPHNPNHIVTPGQHTIAHILARESTYPPEEWLPIATRQDEDGNTVCHQMAKNGMNISAIYLKGMNPNIQNHDGDTFAHILAQRGVCPTWEMLPKDRGLLNKFGMSVLHLLAEQGIIPPEEWPFHRHTPNGSGMMVEFFLAKRGVKNIPERWRCDWDKYDDKGRNAPMFYAMGGMIYPFFKVFWPLDFSKKQDKCLLTVAHHLAFSGLQDAEWTKFNDTDNKSEGGFTVALALASKGVIPLKFNEHNPNIVDGRLNTVGHYLALRAVKPPKQWYGIPALVNEQGKTVAMLLAQNGIVPPAHYVHIHTLKCKAMGYTVADYWKQWEDMGKKKLPSVWYEGVKYIHTTPDKSQQAQCCVCLGEEVPYITTTCKHFIHQACYEQMFAKGENQLGCRCPVCKAKDFVVLDAGVYIE